MKVPLVSFGVNVFGVVGIGVNAGGSLLAIGVNAAAPIALAGVNSIGIVSFAGVNAVGLFGLGGVNSIILMTSNPWGAFAALVVYAIVRAWMSVSNPPPAPDESADLAAAIPLADAADDYAGWIRADAVELDASGMAHLRGGAVMRDARVSPTALADIAGAARHRAAVVVRLGAVIVDNASDDYRHPAAERQLEVRAAVEVPSPPPPWRRALAEKSTLITVIGAFSGAVGTVLFSYFR